MAQNSTIIGLVGLLASGKGTVTKYLQEKHGAATFRYSTMLRDVLNRLHLEVSRDNMQAISTILRKKFGENMLSRVMTFDVLADKNPLIVIDGIRRLTDIEELQKLPNFYLVAVNADQKKRWQRINQRHENTDDSQVSLAEFKKQEVAEAEAEIPAVMAQAQFGIDNNSEEYEDTYRQMEDILKKINEDKS